MGTSGEGGLRPGPSEGWIRGGGLCLGIGIGWEGGEGPEPAWGGRRRMEGGLDKK